MLLGVHSSRDGLIYRIEQGTNARRKALPTATVGLCMLAEGIMLPAVLRSAIRRRAL